MASIIIMVHDTFSEKMFLRTFSGEQFKHIRIIHIPQEMASKGLQEQTEFLSTKIADVIPIDQSFNSEEEKKNFRNQKVALILFESNYGKPASEDINGPLLEHLLKEFSKAKIITYSSTLPSLSKSLTVDERISVLTKGSASPQDLVEIFRNVPQEGLLSSFAPRLFTLPAFKEAVKTLQSPQVSPLFSRQRANSTPIIAATEKDKTTRLGTKSHSFINFTPMYSSSQSVSSSAPASNVNSDGVSMEIEDPNSARTTTYQPGLPCPRDLKF